MPTSKAVLFDAGNTLLHLDYPWLSELAASLGVEVPPGEIAAAAARIVRENCHVYGKVHPTRQAAGVFSASFQAVGRAVGLSPDAALSFALAAHREDESHERGLWRCPAPGAAGALRSLQNAGLRLGVISNSDGSAEEHLRLAGLRGFFATVIDSSRVGVQKPDRRIFEVALQQLGAAAGDSIYVGDILEIDVAGARGAGMGALLYDPWDAYAELTEGRIRSLGEVPMAVGAPAPAHEASG